MCAAHQYLEEFLQVAGDECMVLVECPAALLGVVTVTGQVAEDHLQALLVVAHLSLWQRRALILQRQRQHGRSNVLHRYVEHTNPLVDLASIRAE